MAVGDRWGMVVCPLCGEDRVVVETKKGTGTVYCPAPCGYRAFFNVERERYESAMPGTGRLHTGHEDEMAVYGGDHEGIPDSELTEEQRAAREAQDERVRRGSRALFGEDQEEDGDDDDDGWF